MDAATQSLNEPPRHWTARIAAWLRPEPIRHAFWELFLMRVFFAYIIWRALPQNVGQYQGQPHPNGIAHWIDLSFLADPGHMQWLQWGFWIALGFYVLGVLRVPALAYLLGASVAVCTFLNSQGAIGHTAQIVALAILGQLLAFGWAAIAGRCKRPLRHGLTPEQLAVDWARQAVMATYVVSALTKLVRSDGRWILDAPYFGLQIVKSNAMDYYNTLQPAADDGMRWLAQLLLDHPWTAWFFIGIALPLELFAFVACFNRRTGFWIGLLILIFHSTVSVTMQLGFRFNKLLMIAFFLNIPFWAVWWVRRMRGSRRAPATAAALLAAAGLLALSPVAARAAVDPATAGWVGRKVWQNECGGTVEGLVSWNAGEQFASLGIGHFIWYPEGVRGPFEESFPKLAAHLAARGASVPAWVRGPCPWRTRQEFVAAKDGPQVAALRKLLTNTVPLQTEMLVMRMEAALPKLLTATGATQQAAVRARFEALLGTKEGTFALIDYVNFKGEGTNPDERYRGEGWGLLQVLEGMRGSPAGAAAVREFGASAARVLARRIENSPPARNEAKWLKGWTTRVSAYGGGN
jgi:hypothetical protein